MTNVVKKNNAIDHKCPACRAPIFFKPELGKWKCDYCDNEYTLEEMKKYKNASSVEVERDVPEVHYDSYKCKNCGAEIIADENTASTFCVYCGNTAILKGKLSGKFAPDKIIPFKTLKDDAMNAFKGLKKGRPLLPNDFTSLENVEKIRGLYVPFWLYNVRVYGGIVADATKVRSWSIGDTHYTKTDYYKLYRDGEMKYYHIPVDGSERLSNDIMNTIEPFDYKEMVDYNHAYLSGFLSEKYDFPSEDVYQEAHNRALNSAREVMLSDMSHFSTKKICEDKLLTECQEIKYALLPVWMVNVKYKDKFYLFSMNGQTGEFIGDMPVDTKKTILYSILIFVITFAVVILGSLIAYYFGG